MSQRSATICRRKQRLLQKSAGALKMEDRKLEDRKMQDQLLEWKMQEQIITQSTTCTTTRNC